MIRSFLGTLNSGAVLRAMATAAAVFLLSGCGGSDAGADSDTDDDPSSSEPPAKVDGGPICILSADCPAGQHCDLGECVQSCNTEDPCADSALLCSPRGRCLEEGASDKDPLPAKKTVGQLSLDRNLIVLTEKDESFELKLTSSAEGVVHYRATSQSSFISIAEPRGEFEGTTTLTFAVDQDKYDPEKSGQTVKIFSDLGEQVAQVVLNTGITGKYQGALRYKSNGVSLGDARVLVEVIDRGGDLDVRFDPDVSLLFPADADGAATGFGTLDDEGKGKFTVTQVLGADFAGGGNFFKRALGRRMVVDVAKNRLGGMEGTFTEKIYGVFEEPLELEGTIILAPLPNAARPDFELTVDGTMPDLEVPARDYSGVFGAGSSYGSCGAVMNAVDATWNDSSAELAAVLDDIHAIYYRLDNTMGTRVASGLSYTDLLGLCESELENPTAPVSVDCAWRPALACGMLYAAEVPFATGQSRRDPARFNDLFAATLNPVLLVAQDYAVQAFEHSLAPGGLPKEREAYAQAVASMGPTLSWVLHPSVLSFMTSLSVDDARGPEPGASEDGTESQTFPAGRALSQLLRVLSTVEGERSRLVAIDLAESDGDLVRVAQERALMGLLHSAVLLEITKAWGIAPDVISADLSGFLNPLDAGFGALVEGARAFGVPEGFVPFVWRPEDVGKGASNFEQMLALTEDPRNTEKALEDAYVSNSRAYESSENELRREAQNIKLTYEAQIKTICGSSFDIDSIQSPEDWEACGANDEGELGVLLLDIERADQTIAASQSRLLGMKDKLAIDQRALADKQGVREETMTFIDNSNDQIAALTRAEIMIDTAIKSIEVASNSNFWNAGAPAAMAVGVVALGVAKASIAQGKLRLEEAQSMQLMKQDASLEYIEGMANMQKQVIDISQLALEMMEDGLAKTQAVSRASNLLEEAKSLFELRESAIVIAGKDPAHDPAFRLLRDKQALQLLDARARAQRNLYLTARALEYEVNEPIGGLAGAVLKARSSLAMQQLSSCLNEIYTSYRVAYGSAQDYSTEVSVREMLGIFGTRDDEVTGQELSAGEQFRLITQKNSTFEEDGTLRIQFSTNLQPDNGLWSTDVCSDRISGVQVQLVGDRMGDNEAQVNFSLTGAAFLGRCDSEEVEVWNMAEGAGAGVAVVQAGVNSYGDTMPNSSLFGQAVARASWEISIPPGSVAPSNKDLDLSQLEDILVKVEHEALPRRSTPLFVDTSCLMSIN